MMLNTKYAVQRIYINRHIYLHFKYTRITRKLIDVAFEVGKRSYINEKKNVRIDDR